MGYSYNNSQPDAFDASSQKMSKFNSGVSQIIRLDELLKDAHKHSREGLLMRWNWDLDCVWRELAGDLQETDPRIKIMDNINKAISDAGKNKSKVYTILMDKEIFLRRLQNGLGKGSAYEDEFEDEMD